MSLPTNDKQIADRQRHAVTQFGVMSIIGLIPIAENRELRRGDWIVCNTGRGLELGCVRSLGYSAPPAATEAIGLDCFAGHFVRMATDSDQLANSRLLRNKDKGLTACSQWLIEQGRTEILLDVDITLDGQRLYFHSLGEDNDFDPALNDRLVEIYDSVTGIRKFTQSVSDGCGPDCGSDGSGCSTKSGGCSSCGLKTACQVSNVKN